MLKMKATALVTTLFAGCVAAKEKVKNIIVDTDLFSDVDDVGALLLATTLPNSNLLAVNINVPSTYSAHTASALLGYYGHRDVPLGIARPLSNETFFDNWAYELGEYASKVAYHYRDYAKLEWKDGWGMGELERSVEEGTEEAVALYRKVLAEAEDGSVTICSIGFFNNLSGLLNSTADKYSDLDGPALIAAKVAELVIMGGQYPSGSEFNFFGDSPYHTAHVVNNWAGRMTFSGNEMGGNVYSGKGLLDNGPKNDPAKRAYFWYNYGQPRESWDPLTVLYGVEGLGCMFEYEGEGGRNYVFPNGSNEWRYGEAGDDGMRGEQRWLKLKVKNETGGAKLDELYLRGSWANVPTTGCTVSEKEEL
ncbi:hypothetical protein NLU13_6847 [Sarocladium strictum]|uniref:Inosine/uridine-preferring nucleoside hydrolase domain-containing protein n=1 Tax=Sarocladium strictum TaxID=5046 RepID=A0AA39L6E4_SARSR|nr:hypothetical protein NLU13_6847 [Sarocladium strictum]